MEVGFPLHKPYIPYTGEYLHFRYLKSLVTGRSGIQLYSGLAGCGALGFESGAPLKKESLS